MRLLIPQATKTGSIEVPPRGIFDYSYPTSKNRRGRVQGGVRYAPPYVQAEESCCYMKEFMRLPAAVRTRSDGEWQTGGHYSKLELGREVMNSLTRVSKDTLVIEIYEQTKHTESEIQQAGWHSGIVPQRKVEQCGGDEMPFPKRDTDKPDHGKSSPDNNDLCT